MPKYKVKQLPKSQMHGWWGMNNSAAKKLHPGIKVKKGTVVVQKEMSPSKKKETVRHEKIEDTLIKKQKTGYKKAHKEALYLERRPGNPVKAAMVYLAKKKHAANCKCSTCKKKR